jgi:hypothetical protein
MRYAGAEAPGEAHVRDVSELSRRSLDEFPTGRRVIKKIADLDGGADVPRGRLRIGNEPAAIEDFVSGVIAGAPGENSGLRNGSDAGQRFAAESHRGDAEQIIVVDQFAGGMGSERQRQFARRDPPAVVNDADQLPPAVGDLNQNLRRPRVDGVLDQLLGNGSRPLDHLAGGDAIDQ